MLEPVSPFGFRSPFGRRRNGDPYAVLGFRPELVADWEAEVFRANSVTTTFPSMFTHTRSSNATMVDSDGLLKWAPHNLVLNSATPATQSLTVVSGARYTVECTGTGSVALSGAGTGTVTAGSPVSITASTTTLTLTVSGTVSLMWAYRSDLGGMVAVPADARATPSATTYVPTTSSAVYLPRRGHHVYNGTSWVNEGLLHESEQRTNLVKYSSEFDNIVWGKSQITLTSDSLASPTGLVNAYKVQTTASTGSSYLTQGSLFTTGVGYSVSIHAKAGTASSVRIANVSSSNTGAWFDLSDGTIGTQNDLGGYGNTATIEDVGNGWYRCTRYFASADTSGPDQIIIGVNDADGSTLPAASGQYLYLYGAQVEQAPTPSSYIPTSGATVTRAAETLTIPSAKLPWPTPNVIGPELVTNGTFDTDVSGWTSTAPATATWNSGQVDIVRNSGSAVQQLYQSLTPTLGSVYKVEITVSALSHNVSLYSTGGGVPIGSTITATGDHTRYFVGKSGDNGIYVGAGGSTTATATIDNISVREINPLAVSIQLEGRATGGTLVPLRWNLDANNEITQAIGTTNFSFTQEAAGVVDTVTGGSFTPGINTAFNIASRHGSTFINGAVDGVALTANLTPTALPNLSATNLQLAQSGGPMVISKFRMWAADIGDAGIAEASA